MKNTKLPDKVEKALFPGYIRSTTDYERRFALAMYEGGIKEVKLSESFIAGQTGDIDCLKLSTLSIVTFPYVAGSDNKRPLLWCILDRLDIAFGGGAGDHGEDGGMVQASWSCHPKTTNVGFGWRFMSLPLVVCYFNDIKRLKERSKI